VELKFTPEAFIIPKRQFTYPLFFQIGFHSDWLAYKPLSYEKRIMSPDFAHKLWKNYEMPRLFTPINTYQVLKTKKLILQFKMIEGTYTTQENFAYTKLPLDNLEYD